MPFRVAHRFALACLPHCPSAHFVDGHVLLDTFLVPNSTQLIFRNISYQPAKNLNVLKELFMNTSNVFFRIFLIRFIHFKHIIFFTKHKQIALSILKIKVKF
jgi:hypothetical protein